MSSFQFEVEFDRENGYVVQKLVYMSLPIIEGIYETEEEANLNCSEANLLHNLTQEILADSYGMPRKYAMSMASAILRSNKRRGL